MTLSSERSLPVRRLATRDRDAAYDIMCDAYGREVRVDSIAEKGAFGLAFTIAAIGKLQLIKAEVSGLNCTRTIDGRVQLYVPLQGKLLHRSDGFGERIADARHGAVVKPETPVLQKVTRGSALVLSLETRELANRAEVLTGTPVPPGFTEAMPTAIEFNSLLGGAFARTMKLAYSEILELAGQGLAPLVEQGHEEILINLAAALLVPGVATTLSVPGQQVAPAAIRKVRDYIAEHAADVIEISKLAADAGISMRTLQVNFQKQYGFSPRDYIIECRLELARRKLLDGCPVTGVTDIAILCGFPNLSHFAAKYRDKYGELPSETIRKSRA